MPNQKKYWKSEVELNEQAVWVEELSHKEFAQKLPEDVLGNAELPESDTSRRDFLKYMGFSTAAATLAACEGPVNTSIPYVVQPEQIIPGVANYYATTIVDGFDTASILVKTREGRPIKVENNTDAPLHGAANARVQASVLSLYDSMRVQGPTQSGVDVSWDTLEANVGQQLAQLAQNNEAVALITPSLASPTTKQIIADFQAKFPNVTHYAYDAVSETAALNAFEKAYGTRALPSYDFSKASCIVSIGADFLGDWQGGGFSSGYAKTRVPKGKNGKAKMSKHYQFEANMTLSGANADYRFPTTAVEQQFVLVELYGALTNTSYPTPLGASLKKKVTKIAAELKAAGKEAIVVSGLQSEDAQRAVLAINNVLGSSVIDVKHTSQLRQGDAGVISQLVNDLNAGKVGGVIMAGVNPAYTLPNAEAFVAGLKKTKLSLTFSMKNDETAVHSQWVAAAPHYLESWGDVELKTGHFALTQPTIRPLFDTKQFQDVLLALSGSTQKYDDAIKAYWSSNILGGASFNEALHDGFFVSNASDNVRYNDNVNALVQRLARAKAQSGLELHLYTKTAIGDGQQANNPWLQELPDPISRVTWDNYLTVSKADAEALGLENVNQADGALDGSLAEITLNGVTVKAPVLIQPGQAKGTVGLAFGYGKTAGMKSEMQVGANAYPLYKNFSPVQTVSVAAASGMHKFACTQLQNTLMGRGEIVRETTLEIFNTKDAKYWNPMTQVSRDHVEIDVTSKEADMWQAFDRSIGHHFNLSIDLNACTGCGACVVACHAENNVPVVGKHEIRKSRDMHWLRIDRYYSAEETFKDDLETVENISGLGESLSTFGKMEDPSENPQVTFQPVMCQHCNHAPCETVCPVAASSHGRQGQNHMAYNRCVGTRYCANNCPYKVRRFNWFLYNKNDAFDYHMNDDLGRMVLNPDVVVRSRGVMEKCSLCIQRTQKTILDAKLEGREIKDGEFNTACSSACANGAMVFGDINDKASEVAHLKEDKRMYHLLESVGTEPNVMYQVKVRNT
ncbi:MAG: TAT-variant-translocated molybdopterin oxidoreductase [Flavobacteriaceae bacterium]